MQRLSDYPVFLSTVKHGDCPSEHGQIRENVGLLRCRITEVVRLSRSTECLLVQSNMHGDCPQEHIYIFFFLSSQSLCFFVLFCFI